MPFLFPPFYALPFRLHACSWAGTALNTSTGGARVAVEAQPSRGTGVGVCTTILGQNLPQLKPLGKAETENEEEEGGGRGDGRGRGGRAG